MADLWFWGNYDAWAANGGATPDPVVGGDTTVTWDCEFVTSSDQTTYARTSINSLTDLGGGFFRSGIVSYTTRDAAGVDHPQLVGQSDPDGLVDFISDVSVVGVTFGIVISSNSNPGLFTAHSNYEIWVQ